MIRLPQILGKQFTLLMLVVFLIAQVGMFMEEVRADEPASEPPQSQQRDVGYRGPVFRPGDAVQITVFPDTSSFLNGIFTIDGQGYIFLPVAGRVQISAMTENEFLSYLNQNFTQYLRAPTLQVRPLIRASVLGGVARPNLYYIDPNQSLWDLIHMAGGTLREDGLKKLKWERNKEKIEADLISYYQSGRSLKEMGFRSGDQIWTNTPSDRNFWATFRDISLVITTTISLYFAYVTIVYMQSGRYFPTTGGF